MKLRRLFAALAAGALAVSAMAISAFAEDTKTYYQWGGAQVSWGWDIDGDKNDESKDGVNGSTWLGTVTDGKLTLDIPVAKGATVDFYTLGWDSYDGVQYTVTIDGKDYEAKYVKDAPSFSVTVDADVTSLKADVVYAPDQGDTFNFNDWCGNGVVVTIPGAAEEPKTEEPKTEEPQNTNPPAGAAAGLALAGIAVAGAALVATKRK